MSWEQDLLQATENFQRVVNIELGRIASLNPVTVKLNSMIHRNVFIVESLTKRIVENVYIDWHEPLWQDGYANLTIPLLLKVNDLVIVAVSADKQTLFILGKAVKNV